MGCDRQTSLQPQPVLLYVGLEEVDHGLWDLYLRRVKLGCLLEEKLRIEDHLGRLKRTNV
jgi:hypothetical protein